MSKWNVQQFVTEQLKEVHGYEFLVDGEKTDFRRVVDSQHASLLGATMRPSKVSLSMSVARRDINELRDYVVDGGQGGLFYGPWAPLAHPTSRPPFADMPRGSWLNFRDSEEDVAEWLKVWVPKLESVATLRCVQEEFEFLDPRLTEKTQKARWRQRLVPRMANQMLWGWRGDEDYEEFLVPQLESEQRMESGSAAQLAKRRLVERTEAWIAGHPHGVDRELIGDAKP